MSSLTQIDRILAARRLDAAGDVVIATLVDLQGNGYRRPGARLLVQPDGSVVGAISGGCLERDVARNAFAATRDGPALVCIDTRSGVFGRADRHGTGCDGVLHLLLERPADAALDALARIALARDAARPLALLTIFEGAGRWAGLLGTRAALDDTLIVDGALAGPAHAAIAQALQKARQDRRSHGLTLSEGADTLRALVEFVAPPPELVIVGTGVDAEILAQLAAPLGWRVRVLGGHALGLARFEGHRTQVVSARPTPVELALHADAYVVLMSHGLALDSAVLPIALQSEAAYVGLLGPRRRTAKLMAALHAADRLPSPAELARLATPIGLDIGGDDPTEVALSILAQVVARKNGRAGGAFVEPAIHAAHPHVTVRLDAREVRSA